MREDETDPKSTCFWASHPFIAARALHQWQQMSTDGILCARAYVRHLICISSLNPTASTVDNEKMKPMEIKWLDQSHLLAKSSKLFSVNQTDYQALLRERVDRLGLGLGFRESRWHQRWKAVALPRCETLPVSYVATSSYPQWTPCWTLSRNDHAQELRMFFS